MKLKIYNKNTRSRHSEPFLTFGKNGAVTISQEAAKILELKNGDSIVISQDEEGPKDWYIAKGCDDIIVRDKGSGSLLFNSASIGIELKKSTGLNINKSVRFRMANEPTLQDGVKWYALITSGATELDIKYNKHAEHK